MRSHEGGKRARPAVEPEPDFEHELEEWLPAPGKRQLRNRLARAGDAGPSARGLVDSAWLHLRGGGQRELEALEAATDRGDVDAMERARCAIGRHLLVAEQHLKDAAARVGRAEAGSIAGEVAAIRSVCARISARCDELASRGARAIGDSRSEGPSIPGRASEGVAGRGGPIPHREQIQAAFGRHDVGGIEAHVGGAAAAAAATIGAEAYAIGDRVAFARSPDLHTAAHEAAHVIQQRGGVQLADGVGRSGDMY
ncbi:MAG TPA: DUF4157 domain-containing protein, partial [Kofleriaceae bacterium]|nr:DUF4157 domain-containing protein [Kofleriaceae bacterium]